MHLHTEEIISIKNGRIKLGGWIRRNLPVAISEEQFMAIEVQGVSPPGGKSLMGEIQIDKVLRPQNPKCLLLLLYLNMFAAAIFL